MAGVGPYVWSHGGCLHGCLYTGQLQDLARLARPVLWHDATGAGKWHRTVRAHRHGGQAEDERGAPQEVVPGQQRLLVVLVEARPEVRQEAQQKLRGTVPQGPMSGYRGHIGNAQTPECAVMGENLDAQKCLDIWVKICPADP